MISREEAQGRLRTFHNPNSKADQLARLKKLPSDLSVIGQLLIQSGPEWEKAIKDGARGAQLRKACEREGNLNQAERGRLFAALIPGTAALADETWNLFDELPFQTNYYRKPFRNPGQKLTGARINWLQNFVRAVDGYEDQDIVWLASWTPHLGYYASDSPGYLFAAAMERRDKTGDEVFDILASSLNGTHEIGAMGRHVVRGLLCSPRVEGWELIEKTLLAAQREEGLRQVILEAADESRAPAFRRMLRVILDHNLSRFSSAMRAFSVWFGLPFEAATPKTANKILERVLLYLESPSDRERAIQSGEAQDAYYALWAIAFEDAILANSRASELFRSPDAAKRYAAVYLLARLGVTESLPDLLNALDDEDLRVSACALDGLSLDMINVSLLASSDTFERMERLLARLKHKTQTLKPLVWDWAPISIDREMAMGKLIGYLGERPVQRLLPYLSSMSSLERARVVRVINAKKEKNEKILQTLLAALGDASEGVRREAFYGLDGVLLKDADVVHLESLLSRQSQDLRKGIIKLLWGLSDDKLLESVNRLIQDKNEKRRLAALELLRECRQTDRISEAISPLAGDYKRREALSNDERNLLNGLLSETVEKYTLDDALGLMDSKNLSQPVPVKSPQRAFSKIKLTSPAAVACVKSLDALIEEHRNDTIEIKRGETKTAELLGNIRSSWELNSYTDRRSRESSWFALSAMAETWNAERGKDLRDEDGFELIRAYLIAQLHDRYYSFFRNSVEGVSKELQTHYDFQMDSPLKYPHVVLAIVEWLTTSFMKGETDFIMDALEESVARIPNEELTGFVERYGGMKSRRINMQKVVYLNIARRSRELHSENWERRHHARLWNVVLWLDKPGMDSARGFLELDDLLFAYRHGAATRDDLFNMFLGPKEKSEYGGGFRYLHLFSGRKTFPYEKRQLNEFPVIREVADACRERILDVECKRGELPTAATAPSRNIRSVPGMRNLFRLLLALGDSNPGRGYSHGDSRSETLGRLIRNCFPVEGDSMVSFIEQAKANQIPEKRLIELAVYAPQWAGFVERAVGWDHLTDAVLWFYAHTKDRQWSVEQDIREEWAARIGEHTPLTASDLMDGAMDVAWFRRAYAEMGEERWDQLYAAALYASGGLGHARARLFSDAALGKITTEQTVERVEKKRHQDSVRALGLIPIADEKGKKEEILRRYEVMQEFLRTSKKFGSQRQTSERLAVSIGMQNLARTAGYKDPQRLEWAMEIEAVADLARGPILVHADEYQFTLSINDLGEPILDWTKKGKATKTIPSAVKKKEAVAEVLERKRQLDRQASRMRVSLEQSMRRGDEFTVAELKTLTRHPMLKPMIEQTLFASSDELGYPIRDGTALYRHDGGEIPLTDETRLRIAHPLDLLERGEWHDWQHECFIAERIQPFKQVFRELYVLTSAEKGEGNLSRRYAGHQVNPRQALALFASREWLVAPEEGVQKTFHEANISARVGFLQDILTPAEVEGLTVEAVAFTNRGEWKPLRLETVPPRIFSEVMRDLDLVVSVAHAGGIDPEASASSVEARAALIRETCSLLNLANVKLSDHHVLIDGKLTHYSVNLGSGGVHKQPGGALCIIPVHSQHRGRIYLPFADDDPKTAEIVSKVILLARDDQIKDPTILEQIL